MYEYLPMDKTITSWIHDPKTDPERFIDQFMRRAVASDNYSDHSCELFRMHFRAGYCWHFAHILKAVFNRGEVCWTAPFGHMVWRDEDGTPYDIEGVYDGEAMYLIPEKYVSEYLHEFKHIHGMDNTTNKPSTKQDLMHIVKKYCTETGQPYRPEIENCFLDNNTPTTRKA